MRRLIHFSAKKRNLPPSRIAIFIDWCSLYQRRGETKPQRTSSEHRVFRLALGTMQVSSSWTRVTFIVTAASSLRQAWYAHQHSSVWRLTIPLTTSVKLHLPEIDERGWPTFERRVASLFGKRILDIGRLWNELSASRNELQHYDWDATIWKEYSKDALRLPLLPEAFDEEIDLKKFTNGSDVGDVKSLYEHSFRQFMSTQVKWDPNPNPVPRLEIDKFGVPEATELAKFMPFCENLEELHLEGNKQMFEATFRKVVAQLADDEVITQERKKEILACIRSSGNPQGQRMRSSSIGGAVMQGRNVQRLANNTKARLALQSQQHEVGAQLSQL